MLLRAAKYTSTGAAVTVIGGREQCSEYTESEVSQTSGEPEPRAAERRFGWTIVCSISTLTRRART